MKQFKILTKAVDLFKKINNGEYERNLRLHKVELEDERTFFDHTLFNFQEDTFSDSNRAALEHARICAYEIMLNK